MATHFMKLNSEPFCKIKNGTKVYELRLYDEKRKLIKVGDLIEFTNRNDNRKCTVQVTELKIFNSFADLYEKLPLTQCGYDTSELNNATPTDMEKYYPPEKQKLYGVVAIKVKLL